MQYRLYKIMIQDLALAQSMLTNVPLNKSRRIWVRGLLEDNKRRVLKDNDTSLDARGIVSKRLESILLSLDTLPSLKLLSEIEQLIVLFKQHVEVKIRIDILFARPVSAIYLIPIYQELRKHRFIDARIIAGDFYPTDIYSASGQYDQLTGYLESMDMEYTSYKDYDLFDNPPDLFFYSFLAYCNAKPVHLLPSTVIPLIDRTMYLEHTLTPLDLMVYDSNYRLTPFTWLQFRTSQFSYNSISWGDQDIVTGHPLMDLSHQIYSGNADIKIPDTWVELSKGKKVILWNLIPITNSDTSINTASTKAKMTETIGLLKEIGKRFESVFIILRPHPACLTSEYLDHFVNLQGNIILDQNTDSYPALSFSDAYIGDQSSLYMQFLPSCRPALLFNAPHHSSNLVFWTQTNVSTKQADVFEFVSRLLNDYDSMLRPVTEIDKYCLGPMDGNNSKRIAEAMITKLYKEELTFIEVYCSPLAEGIAEMETLR